MDDNTLYAIIVICLALIVIAYFWAMSRSRPTVQKHYGTTPEWRSTTYEPSVPSKKPNGTPPKVR